MSMAALPHCTRGGILFFINVAARRGSGAIAIFYLSS
jgi:hypothetical protein